MSEDFARRLKHAWLALQASECAEVDQREIGKRVGKALKRKAFSQGSVSRWFRGTVPDVATVRAIAAVMRVEPGWLAFGEGAMPASGAGNVDADDVPEAEDLSQVQDADQKRSRKSG